MFDQCWLEIRMLADADMASNLCTQREGGGGGGGRGGGGGERRRGSFWSGATVLSSEIR